MRKFLVNIEGKQYEVGVEEITDGSVVTPVVTEVKTAAPAKQAAPAKAATGPANGTKLLSPFPGMVKNLLVADGATVKKGQAILVLEAMKMDNDLTAEADGVVKFNVAKGANVETGDVLAVIG